MVESDLHGKKVKEAEDLFVSYLNDARMKGKLLEINFITGTGPIQQRLKALAQEHDLHHYIPVNNRGCIVIEFE